MRQPMNADPGYKGLIPHDKRISVTSWDYSKMSAGY